MDMAFDLSYFIENYKLHLHGFIILQNVWICFNNYAVNILAEIKLSMAPQI